jgi:hypothetical protein
MIRVHTYAGAIFEVDLRQRRARCTTGDIIVCGRRLACGQWLRPVELDILQYRIPLRLRLERYRASPCFFNSSSNVNMITSLQ